VQDVRREHFSFSPRMPVGDFYEERETPEVGLGAAEPPRPPPLQQEVTRVCAAGSAVGEAEPRGDPLAHPGHHGQARATPQRREGQAQGAAGCEARPGPASQGQNGRLAEQDGRAAAEEAGSPRYPLRGPASSGRLLQPLEPGSGGSPAAGPSPPSRSALAEVLSDEDKLKMSKIKKKMRRKVRAAAWGSGWCWAPPGLAQGLPWCGRATRSLSWWSPLQAKNKQKQDAKAPRAKETKKKCKVSLQGARGPGRGRRRSRSPHAPRGLSSGQGEGQTGEGQGEGAAQGEEGERGSKGGQGAAGPAARGGAAAAAAHPGGDEEAHGRHVSG